MRALKIGFIRNALHAGCASAVARVVEAHGHEVDYADLAENDVPAALAAQQVDIYASAWMPKDEALLEKGYRSVGDLYQPVASFLSIGDVTFSGQDAVSCDSIFVSETVAQLCPEQFASYEMFKPHPVEIVADAALHDCLSEGLASGRRALALAMQPHALFFDSRFRLRDSELKAFSAPMRAPLLVTADLAQNGDADLIDELSEMMLGAKVMSALDYAITVEGQDPEDAAEAWQRGRLIPR